MKMLKKLMAVALAGALALTVLTGCGATVNKKELIKVINDTNSIGFYHKVEYEDAGTAQADKVIELVNKAYADTKDDAKADFDPMKALQDENEKYPEVCKALGIDANTKDRYELAIAKVQKYSSKYNQEHATMMLVQELSMNSRPLNNASATANKGTISLNTVTLGGTEYLVAVFKTLA